MASDLEEVPPKGVIQTLQHKDHIFHLPDQRGGIKPQEVPYLWVQKMSIRQQYPRASGVLTSEGVAKTTDHPGFRFRNLGTHGDCLFL